MHHAVNPNDHNVPRITPSHVTVVVCADEDNPGRVHIAGAMCDPRDQFCKATGVDKACVKLNISEEQYGKAMERYRKGQYVDNNGGIVNPSKPAGFRLNVAVEDLTEETWNEKSNELMRQFIPIFVQFYTDQKLEHARRLQVSRRQEDLVSA